MLIRFFEVTQGTHCSAALATSGQCPLYLSIDVLCGCRWLSVAKISVEVLIGLLGIPLSRVKLTNEWSSELCADDCRHWLACSRVTDLCLCSYSCKVGFLSASCQNTDCARWTFAPFCCKFNQVNVCHITFSVQCAIFRHLVRATVQYTS